MFLANAYFQSSLFQASKAKSDTVTAQKEHAKLQKEFKNQESKLFSAENEVDQLRARVEQLQMKKHEIIDEYLDSEDYEADIERHDNLAFPGVFESCWKQAITAMNKKFPGVFDPEKDFPVPGYVPAVASPSHRIEFTSQGADYIPYNGEENIPTETQGGASSPSFSLFVFWL